MMQCLTDIIGVTKTGVCYTADTVKQGLLLKSNSGLYIDEVEGGITLQAVGDSDTCNALADIILDTKLQAIQRTENDIRIQIADKYQHSARPYTGSIGETSFTGSLPASPYIGQKWVSNGLIDAVITVKKIQFLGTVGVGAVANNLVLLARVGNSNDIRVIKTISLTAANQTNVIPTETVRLPLTEDGEIMTYFWMLDATSIIARNNRAQCNCAKNILLTTFMSIYGFTSSSNNPNAIGTDTDAHGLVFDVEVRCDDSQLICREYDRNNAISLTLAYAALYKASELLIEAVLRSPEVSRFTMMNREYLWGKRNHFKKEYEDRILYLRSVVDVSESACFICRSTDLIFGNIIS